MATSTLPDGIAFSWSRVSAGEKGWCPGLRDGGTCFLRSARERAEQAHIVVVNHALLLSDLVRGGSLIPDYQHLVIDEAHNLEDEATRQLGFQVAGERLEEASEPQARLTTEVRLALGAESLDSAVRREGERSISDVETLAPTLREHWGPPVGCRGTAHLPRCATTPLTSRPSYCSAAKFTDSRCGPIWPLTGRTWTLGCNKPSTHYPGCKDSWRPLLCRRPTTNRPWPWKQSPYRTILNFLGVSLAPSWVSLMTAASTG